MNRRRRAVRRIKTRIKTPLATRRRLGPRSPRMLAVESKPGSAGNSASPPLSFENGELMHSPEFPSRYEQMPRVKKAELIEGVAFPGSRVPGCHARADALIQGWLVAYASRHPETEVHPNATVILDAKNTVQPEVRLCRLSAALLLAGDTAPSRPRENQSENCCPFSARLNTIP